MFVTSSSCSVTPRVGQIETVPVTHSSRWRPQQSESFANCDNQRIHPVTHGTISTQPANEGTNFIPQPPTQLFSKDQKSKTFIATITSTVL